MANVPEPAPPLDPVPDLSCRKLGGHLQQMPGLERYHRLGLGEKLRGYQKEGAIFLALRAYALNCDPMRAGKCIQSIAGAELTGAEKTIIVSPALVTNVWAEEVAKWAQEEAVILKGRGGTTARQFCMVCMGRGYTEDRAHCPGCRLRNGQSHGTRILEVGDEGRDLYEALEKARYVIVNYELLQAQVRRDSAGGRSIDSSLPGWNPVLSRYHFDVAIIDEIHEVRGWNTDRSKAGHTRRDKLIQLVDPIPRVWGLTGTPVFGFTKDLWSPLDIISKGACTGPSRLWFTWTKRYCDAEKGEYGWVYDGRSIYADTELPERLRWVKIQRPRSLILAQMPPKQRIVHRLEPDEKARKDAEALARTVSQGKSTKGKMSRLLGATGVLKRDTVIQHVMDELANGDKVVIFALLKRSAEQLYKALGKEMKKRQWATRMRSVNAMAWLAHGENVSAAKRGLVARAFREHQGAAALIATIDAMQVGISLKGASSVHFAELHWSPAAMLQAEDRPYELGVTGLNIVYYVVRNSVDEHVEAVIMPKFVAQERLVAEQGATDVRAAFEGPEETEDEIFARLVSHLDEDDVPWDWEA